MRSVLDLPAEPGLDDTGRDMLREAVRDLLLPGTEGGADPVPRRQDLLARLLGLADRVMDRLDDGISGGLQAGPPNLLLVLDQFEEVFRPEVAAERGGQRDDLLNLIVDVHSHLGRNPDSGLFLAVTMRSEELHRCTEHPGLAEVVNTSSYLLDLLDPEHDAEALRDAIVTPARVTFAEWGLRGLLDPGAPDAPFDEGVVDWLRAGASCLCARLEHRPDQLPLLQHALQAMWHSAMADWSRRLDRVEDADGRAVFDAKQFRLRREHLPGQTSNVDAAAPPDLSACLNHCAEDAHAEAARLFSAAHAAPVALAVEQERANAATRAAFLALARRDDRGNWARRFADVRGMRAFLSGDQRFRGLPAEPIEHGFEAALGGFVRRGYVVSKAGRYDISHEALIRNWRRYQEWLRDPEEVSQALARAVTELEPARLEEPDAAVEEALKGDLPPSLCEKLGVIFDAGRLSEGWAVEQLVPLLRRPAVAERWRAGEAPACDPAASPAHEAEEAFATGVLARLRGLVARAVEARERARTLRLKAAEDARRRLRRRFRLAVSAVVLVALVAVSGFAFWDYNERRVLADRLRTFGAWDVSGNDFRTRALLLLASLSQSDGPWGRFLETDETRQALRAVLLRSPRFGEARAYEAVGVSPDGGGLALLSDNTLVVRRLGAPDGPPLPALPPLGAEPAAGSAGRGLGRFGGMRTSAGFLSGMEAGGAPAVFRDGLLTFWRQGRWQDPVNVEDLLRGLARDEVFTSAQSWRSAEFANGAFRVTASPRSTEQRTMHLVEFRGGPDAEQPLALSTSPTRLSPSLRYLPTLAPNCGRFAELRTTESDGQAIYHLRLGQLDVPRQSTEAVVLPVQGRLEDSPSVAFTSDCGSVVVRAGSNALHVYPITVEGGTARIGDGRTSLRVLTDAGQETVQPAFPRMRPLLAAARDGEGGWRFAWQVRGGVAVVEASPRMPTDAVPFRGWRKLLSDLDDDGANLLRFSEDGRYLTLVEQSFGRASAQVRVWDLTEERARSIEAMGPAELRDEACAVAKQGRDGNALNHQERLAWFGREDAPQPCDG